MKFTRILLVSCLCAFSPNAFSQWSSVLNPTSTSTKAAAVAVDQVGNIYVGGSAFANTTEKENYYLVKYNPQGDTLWTRTYNRANGSDQIAKIVIDGDNNVIVTGTSYSTSNAEDIVTLKYDPSGNILNSYIYDGVNHLADKATDLISDNSGNYYIGGISRAVAYSGYVLIKTNHELVRKWAKVENPYYGSKIKKIAFNPVCQRIAVTGYHSEWSNKALIGTYVYDSTGVKLWGKYYQKVVDFSAVGYDVMIYNEGEVYVCGYETNAESNKWEAILIKFNNVGDTVWTKKVSAGTGLLSIYKSMTHDAEGNIYVTGYKDNTIITTKYNLEGSVLWSKEAEGKLYDADNDTFESIKIDNNGNVLVLTNCFSGGGTGTQLIKYSGTGNHLWTKQYKDSPSLMDYPTTFTIDAANNIYAVISSRNNSYYFDMATVKFTATSTGLLPVKSELQEMSIYPNPSTGTFYVDGKNGDRIVTVYSSNGLKIFQTELPAADKSIHLEDMPNGLYFIKLEGNGISAYTKIMIRR